MYTPFTSRHFTQYTDPVSHQRVAILSTRIAPVQQGMYFVNSGASDDHRYLWFMCAFPPAAPHSMAVIDFLTDEIHHFPDTTGVSGCLVDGKTGNLYFGCGQGIYVRNTNPKDPPVRIACPPEAVRKLGGGCGCSHLTFTPDRKELIVDFSTSQGCFLGSVNVATGEFTQWYRTEKGTNYNHAQCCPIDGNTMMCAHELWNSKLNRNDPVFVDGIYPRLQIIRRDGTRTMLKPYGNGATHEWWAPDGKSVYYINNNVQESGVGVVARDKLDGSAPEVICSCSTPGAFNNLWHAQCSQDENYFVMDAAYPCMGKDIWRGAESMVYFHNHLTGKTIKFITKNPVVEGWTPEFSCPYHIDPHPRFVMDDKYITFTATVMGRVDLAIAEVAPLIEATK